MCNSQKTPAASEKRLSPKQMQAIPLLARGQTIAKTAADIGVHEGTIDSWKKQAHFMSAVEAAEDDVFKAELKLLRKTVKPAIACLVRNMNEAKPYVQVQASSKLLDLAMDVNAMQALEARIVELEDIIRLKVTG